MVQMLRAQLQHFYAQRNKELMAGSVPFFSVDFLGAGDRGGELD